MSSSLPPHPSAPLLPSAHSASHAHPSSYHAFIASRFYPSKNFPQLGTGPVIQARELQDKVLRWYEEEKDSRGMPWRKDMDLETASKEERSQRGYEVWVSEIMLQQTQVSTVIAYFTRWLERFPTVDALAAAEIEQVNEVWSGLGYYSRASRLLSGAQKVVKEFGGKMPESVEDLLTIDGIGPYSAGAISSIAFGRRSALVDGNVTRVLSRLTAHHAPSTAKATTNYIWALADLLVPPRKKVNSGRDNQPGAWNQAIMELGATVCTPKNPKCSECPLRESCLAFSEVKYSRTRSSSPDKKRPRLDEEGDIEDLCTLCTPFDATLKGFEVTQYPQAKEKKKVREEETAVCVVEWLPESSSGDEEDSKILVVKRPEKGLLAGLYEFPAVDLDPSSPSTSPSRATALEDLFSNLLVPSFPPISQSEISNHKASHSPHFTSPLILSAKKDLSSLLHVYSHQKREYHILHIVLTSSSAASSATSSEGDPPKLQKGSRAKWVSRKDVGGKGERAVTVGGAMAKIWDAVREGSVVLENGKKKKKPEGGVMGKAKGKGKAKTSEGGKGQNGSLDAFFGKARDGQVKKEGGETGKMKKGEEEEQEGREVVIMTPKVVTPARKKPRIVISDDEEE